MQTNADGNYGAVVFRKFENLMVNIFYKFWWYFLFFHVFPSCQSSDNANLVNQVDNDISPQFYRLTTIKSIHPRVERECTNIRET